MILAKKSVAGMKPYVNGNHTAELIRNHKKIIKLDSNEATIGPSPRVMAEILNHLQNGPINWYPDVESSELCARLTTYVSLPVDHILTFNGSDHALETIARTFLSAGDEVVFCEPSYDHFRVYAESCDANLVPVLGVTAQNLTEKISAAVTERTKIIYLVNPNNPTGLLLSPTTISEVLSTFPEALVVVDEAYFEFTGVSVAPLVSRFSNLIVTRSFSKAFGLASLRCGYLLAKPGLCSQIAKIRVGKSINSLAQVAAAAALDDLEYMTRYVDEVADAKAWILERLNDIGVEAYNTPANFVLFKATDPARVLQTLEAQNVYIRDRSHLPGLSGFLRLSIGDALIMKRFWKILAQIPRTFLTANAAAPLDKLTGPFFASAVQNVIAKDR
jgi:histidinol-phosphate aminotransferase